MIVSKLKEEVLQAAKDKPEDWRLGQFIFNYINATYGDVARKVQFEDRIDCFYFDEYIDKFIERCANYIQ